MILKILGSYGKDRAAGLFQMLFQSGGKRGAGTFGETKGNTYYTTAAVGPQKAQAFPVVDHLPS